MKLIADSFFARMFVRAVCLCNHVRAEFGDSYIDVIRRSQVIRISKLHMPYVIDLAHSFEDYFTPVVPKIQGNREIADYSQPRLHKFRENGLEFELTSLPEEVSALEGYFRWYRPAAGDVVFDVGAYCGVSTYHFSKLVGISGHVYAFEPDASNYESLNTNIERHQLANVTALRIGLAGHNGAAEFHSEGALGSTIARSAARPSARSVEYIETITFEEACCRFGVPSFAKIDIEGAEIEMLEASRDFVASHAIQFAVDTNHRVNGKLTFTAVESILTKCGYEVESSNSSGFMTTWARKSK
jgi:FkbM family methyltransferase